MFGEFQYKKDDSINYNELIRKRNPKELPYFNI